MAQDLSRHETAGQHIYSLEEPDSSEDDQRNTRDV
jgi:hypothetical protein